MPTNGVATILAVQQRRCHLMKRSIWIRGDDRLYANRRDRPPPARPLIGGSAAHRPATKTPAKAGGGSDNKGGSPKTAGTNPTARAPDGPSRRGPAHNLPSGKQGQGRSRRH